MVKCFKSSDVRSKRQSCHRQMETWPWSHQERGILLFKLDKHCSKNKPSSQSLISNFRKIPPSNGKCFEMLPNIWKIIIFFDLSFKLNTVQYWVYLWTEDINHELCNVMRAAYVYYHIIICSRLEFHHPAILDDLLSLLWLVTSCLPCKCPVTTDAAIYSIDHRARGKH